MDWRGGAESEEAEGGILWEGTGSEIGGWSGGDGGEEGEEGCDFDIHFEEERMCCFCWNNECN